MEQEELQGEIIAFDLAPAMVLLLDESNGFEPYTQVGVIVSIFENLIIETTRS